MVTVVSCKIKKEIGFEGAKEIEMLLQDQQRNLSEKCKGDLWKYVLSFFQFRPIVVLWLVMNFSTVVEQLINNSSQTAVVNFCLHS